MTSVKLVTIGLPIWKRLEYLPHVLKLIEAQDHPSIELLVSDNGLNGTKVQEAVRANYSRPFTFRQNASIAELPEHFNQIVQQASGEFFVMLSDDDEITPTFVSELVGLLERYPQASVAFAKQEIITEEGVVLRKSMEPSVDIMSGPDFIRATWKRFQLGFEALGTNLARLATIRGCGGYPSFRRGSGIDNALVIKLCLNSSIAFGKKCAWRFRVYEASHGWQVSIKDLAASTKEFIRFLDTDPVINGLARANPGQWDELKGALVYNEWQTYFWRWREIYRSRLSTFEWTRAAFAMPLILPYYRKVAAAFRTELKTSAQKILRIQPDVKKEAGYFERTQ